jgi:hypothetical protein
LLFEFAGSPEKAEELRGLLQHPERLVQRTAHMQELMGMVEAAKKLLVTAAPADPAATPPLPPTADPAAALPLPLPLPLPAGGAGKAANSALPVASAMGGLQLPAAAAAAQPAATGRRGGGRKRKGARWLACLPALLPDAVPFCYLPRGMHRSQMFPSCGSKLTTLLPFRRPLLPRSVSRQRAQRRPQHPQR